MRCLKLSGNDNFERKKERLSFSGMAFPRSLGSEVFQVVNTVGKMINGVLKLLGEYVWFVEGSMISGLVVQDSQNSISQVGLSGRSYQGDQRDYLLIYNLFPHFNQIVNFK